MKRTVAVALLGALSVMTTQACSGRELPPQGQLLLYVDIDAQVPPAPDAESDPARVPPLFDRIRFEVFRGGRPVPFGANQRDFYVHEKLFREHRVSVGIVPPPGDGALTARVRVFRGDRVIESEPPSAISLDTTIALPPVGSEGIHPISLFLSTGDIGKRIGVTTPVLPIDGTPTGPSRVGTWVGSLRVPCFGSPSADETCIPGGSFLMGDPAFRGRTLGNDMFDERLVTLSPYFLQLAEVTVHDFRVAWPALKAKSAEPPTMWSGNRDGNAVEDWCTWTDPPATSASDDQPLNCVTWATARAYCSALGRDLPTEAQYEFVMSGLGREQGYPWGEQEPTCDEAVYGRAGFGALSIWVGTCRQPESIGGMAAPGTGTLDRLGKDQLHNDEKSELLDIGGNMSEWARDQWSRPDEAFWSPVRILHDPIADLMGTDGDKRTIRGGSWLGAALTTRAAYRLQNAPTDKLRSTGFRCARPARQ